MGEGIQLIIVTAKRRWHSHPLKVQFSLELIFKILSPVQTRTRLRAVRQPPFDHLSFSFFPKPSLRDSVLS